MVINRNGERSRRFLSSPKNPGIGNENTTTTTTQQPDP
jgi:hypothetical protein